MTDGNPLTPAVFQVLLALANGPGGRAHGYGIMGFVADVTGGAVELFRTVLPDGTVLFVDVAIGEARLLVSQEIAALDSLAPATIGGTPLLLTLETTDPDDVARRAVFAGATVEAPVEEMFFGE